MIVLLSVQLASDNVPSGSCYGARCGTKRVRYTDMPRIMRASTAAAGRFLGTAEAREGCG